MNILSSNNKLMRYSRGVQKFLLGIKCPWFAAGTDFLTVLDAYKNDFAKTTAYLDSLLQHGKGGGWNILAFNAHCSGGGRHRLSFGHRGHGRGGCNWRGGWGGHGGSCARGGRNLIFLSDHTLTRSGRFLATMRRARYSLFAINMNGKRSMRSRYRRIQSLRSPIFWSHITLVQKPQRRKRFPVILWPARLVAVYEDVPL